MKINIVKIIFVILFVICSLKVSSAHIIKQSDLYGTWATSNGRGLINLTSINSAGEGLDFLIIRDGNENFKISQDFTWEFDETTHVFSQIIRKVTYLINGNERVEILEDYNKSTGLIEALEINNKVIGITFIDEENEGKTFFKVDPETVRSFLPIAFQD